jgi:hypothetical protein
VSFPVSVPDITMYAGDTFVSPSYIMKTGSPLAPINLVTEGWTNWTAQWRTNQVDPNYIAFTVDTTQASSGVISFTATATQSRSFWNGVWDVQATNGTEVRTWIRGKLNYVEDVTR